MTRPLAAFAVAVGLVAAVAAWAETPKLTSTSPFGVRRGEGTEVTFFGSNLEGKARLIAPFSAEVVPINADVASWKVRITPSADTPIGVYPCRIRTDDGLTGPFLFAVGQVPQVAEKEDNGAFDQAQVIPTPCVVEGKAEGNDVDFFRFSGKKGQRIVVDAQCSRIGSEVDPSIRLSTASHAYVASADDTPGLVTDARLTTVLPEDTDYVIELSDSRYQGTGKATYRLVVGALPVADEIFPLGGRQGETIGLELQGGTLPGPSVGATTLRPNPEVDPNIFHSRLTNHSLGIAGTGEAVLDVESMPPLVVSDLPELREPTVPGSPILKAAAPVVFNGRIGTKGEEDRYVVVVTPGQKVRIEVAAAELGSALDGVLQVKGPDGAVLATADDTQSPHQSKAKAAAKKAATLNTPDPSVDYTVPNGISEITLALRDLRGEGGIGYPYRLTVKPVAQTTFQVTTTDDQINIPRGGTASVAVTVDRQGFAQPITLNVLNLPPGLSVRPGRINPGFSIGALTITGTPEASFEIANLKLVGEAQGPGGRIVVGTSKTIVFAEQGTLASNQMDQEGLPAATSLPTPITLDSPTSPIEAVPGYPVNIPVKATRSAGTEDVVLTFGSLPMPSGFTIAPSTIAAKATEGNAVVNLGEAPIGPTPVALTAKGSIGGKEKTLAIPLVTLEVVRPASVELAMPAVEVKAGATVELKGKVNRKGPFKEPVTVRIDALPAGLKADPVAVPPDQSEFTLKIVADPKAAPAQGTGQVALAFQVAKKDYPVPTAPLALKILAP